MAAVTSVPTAERPAVARSLAAAGLRLRTLTVGPVSCKCTILACPATGVAAVVDPGGHPEEILAEVADLGVNVKLVLCTHAHFDHILGANQVVAVTGAEVLLHAADRSLYENLPAQGRAFGFFAPTPPSVTRWLNGGEIITIGEIAAQVLHTPGHTPGSVSYYFSSPSPLLLAGDTLFADSVGRTDLPGGSFDDLERSIREKLYVLPGETRVVPGHGPATTIAHEREHNPFVRVRFAG
jgi:hydroxyacylglutathione hydrolase